MSFIKEIAVKDLFGLYDHRIEVHSKPRITVIAGPNGIGKSTLLSMTQALMTGDARELGKHDFHEFHVQLRDGHKLTVEQQIVEDDSEETSKRLHVTLAKGDRLIADDTFDPGRAPHDLSLPPYVEQQGPDLFFDRRMGEYFALEEAAARYGRPRHPGRPRQKSRWWFDQESEDAGWDVDFIETKRLDTLIAKRHRGPRKREAEAPIQIYLEDVAQRLTLAQRQSDRTRQVRDRSFARRLLDKASKMNVKEPLLRERYAAISREAESLARNGLLTDSLDVLPEERLTPTDKRILSLFLDDFEAKLKPLRPLSSRVEMLQDVIGSKFLNKRIEVDPARGVEFFAEPDNHPIAPQFLSSGEQHQLALISRLLFRENSGTTVLIDEPELSLHVSWQHQMIDDLVEIAKIANLSFVIATHSTAIINGRWDLVDELGPISPREGSDKD
jgi:energy-coupling factor transporter ATP-binding protein EcfA2